MIKPTVGRKVWWWQDGEPESAQAESVQPEDATIIFVHDDQTVNLHIISHTGEPDTILRAHLVQPFAAAKPRAAYATWMPYQVTQAAKG